MAEFPPCVVILGGINGAGKTTSSRRLLADRLQLMTFVNADIIAQGLNGFAPEEAAFEAGRVMLQRLAALVTLRADFAFETTLAGRAYISFLKDVKAAGYQIELIYFWLESPELAITRVQDRVRRGGHDIPEATIRQRYLRSIQNFWYLYRPLADHWFVFDNSHSVTIPIANGCREEEPTVLEIESWDTFQKRVNDAA